MLDGDSWKNGDKPMATPVDMRKFAEIKARLLLSVTDYNGIMDVCVSAVSPDGDYCELVSGVSNADPFGIWTCRGGTWVPVRDCQILSVLYIPPFETVKEKAEEIILWGGKGKGKKNDKNKGG